MYIERFLYLSRTLRSMTYGAAVTLVCVAVFMDGGLRVFWIGMFALALVSFVMAGVCYWLYKRLA